MLIEKSHVAGTESYRVMFELVQGDCEMHELPAVIAGLGQLVIRNLHNQGLREKIAVLGVRLAALDYFEEDAYGKKSLKPTALTAITKEGLSIVAAGLRNTADTTKEDVTFLAQGAPPHSASVRVVETMAAEQMLKTMERMDIAPLPLPTVPFGFRPTS